MVATHAPIPAGEAIHAGFWHRSAAYAIDGFMVFVVWYVLGLLIGVAFAVKTGSAASMAMREGRAAFMATPMIAGLLGLTVGWLYFALQESSVRQATPGKLTLSIKVTDEAGHRIGLRRATSRFFCKLLSFLTLAIGFMSAGFTARKQALHDLLAGTLVVFGDVQPNSPTPTLRPPMPWQGWVLNILLVGGLVLCTLTFIGLYLLAVGGGAGGAAGL